MDFNEINAIIKKLVKSGAAEVSFETKDLKLTVKNHPKYASVVSTQAQTQLPIVGNLQQATQKDLANVANEVGSDKHKIIKSPMVGIFYRKPTPEKPPYVNVGDKVKKGTVICLIEAMKLFNEIESEYSGKIIQTLVDDGTPVEYDQPLFLVDPE